MSTEQPQDERQCEAEIRVGARPVRCDRRKGHRGDHGAELGSTRLTWATEKEDA